MRTAILVLSGTLLGAGVSPAGEKNMMHCFAFTAIDTAAAADWEAWSKASDAMPGKMDGIVKRVWFGKLRGTLAVYEVDGESRKRLRAGEKSVKAEVSYRPRNWGMCIELNGLNSLQAYAKHPYHAEWGKAYEKIRVEGTTTYDILGQ